MDEEAHRLVTALLRAGQDKYSTSFSIQNASGVDTGEEFLVFAVRVKKGAGSMEKLERAFKAVAKPAGQPCPTCHGTGIVY